MTEHTFDPLVAGFISDALRAFRPLPLLRIAAEIESALSTPSADPPGSLLATSVACERVVSPLADDVVVSIVAAAVPPDTSGRPAAAGTPSRRRHDPNPIIGVSVGASRGAEPISLCDEEAAGWAFAALPRRAEDEGIVELRQDRSPTPPAFRHYLWFPGGIVGEGREAA